LETVALVIAFIGGMVFLAHLFSAIFVRTRIPDIIFLIIIGICIGPVLGWVSPSLFGPVGSIFTTITLVIILFEGGIALRIASIRSVLGRATLLSFLAFFFTMGVAAGLGIWLLDLEIIPAFILGAIVGSTSEAVVIPMVRQLDVEEGTRTLLSVESTVNDVLSIVITIALVQAYTAGKFEIAYVSGHLALSFFVAIIIGIAGAFIWSLLLNRIRIIKNAIFTTPAFVFIIYGAVETLGFSGAIAALSFGITIGNIERLSIPFFKKHVEAVGLSETEKIFFSEVAFLLKTFFFIYMGISMQLISSWFIIVAFIFVIAAFFVRVLAVRVSVKRATPSRDITLMMVMIPKGLAAVVLAGIPLKEGIAGGDIIQNITYGAIIFSIIITSLLVFMQKKKKTPPMDGVIELEDRWKITG
jgi:cell volume regulation protein A